MGRPKSDKKETSDTAIGGFQFKVEGKVQGVSFRKYTQKKAREVGSVVGWIRNTERGTVEGEVASRSLEKLQILQEWLRMTGSPRSEITKAHFQQLSVEQVQALLTKMDDFEIKETTR